MSNIEADPASQVCEPDVHDPADVLVLQPREVPLGGPRAIREPGAASLTIASGPRDVRLEVLGGEPFADAVIMWRNFLGRSTDEIRDQRAEWMAHSDRFGTVPGYEPAAAGRLTWLPAPDLPEITLRPRRR